MINVNFFPTKLGSSGFPIMPDFSFAIEMRSGFIYAVDLKPNNGIIAWLRPELTPHKDRPLFDHYAAFMYVPMSRHKHYVSNNKFTDLVIVENHEPSQHLPGIAFIQLEQGHKFVARHFAAWDINIPRTTGDYENHIFITIPGTHLIYAARCELISTPATDLQSILGQIPSSHRDARFD